MMFLVKIDKLMQKLRSCSYCQHNSMSSSESTGVTGYKEKLGRYKTILFLILVIWMFCFAFYRNNVPLKTLDPNRVKETSEGVG